MAHIYMAFDFGSDEDKAQQARHKLEGWKQAFRLDKKLLYKFERSGIEEAGAASDAAEEAKPAKSKGGKAGKGKAKSESAKAKAKDAAKESSHETDQGSGNVKLYLRLALSNHEKMTEERLVKRIPAEEPFSEADPKIVKDGGAGFADVDAKFESLE
ncbi:MAG TPA: hypothetical protein VLC94_01410 [Candidatus Acidoferrum sp.]|nr:hypothetical protein [Candidatus Acidoferrum sp.]